MRHFYPRSPRGERLPRNLLPLVVPDFYPRSPRGERLQLFHNAHGVSPYFYPRSPRGERRPSRIIWPSGSLYFYPRSPRGERPAHLAVAVAESVISIHAPREGSDGAAAGCKEGRLISIHAPREGSDGCALGVEFGGLSFLSTLPARGATSSGQHHLDRRQNFYPRSPRGERRDNDFRMDWIANISIHAPREGSDAPAASGSRSGRYFYPRSPRGERPTWPPS